MMLGQDLEAKATRFVDSAGDHTGVVWSLGPFIGWDIITINLYRRVHRYSKEVKTADYINKTQRLLDSTAS